MNVRIPNNKIIAVADIFKNVKGVRSNQERAILGALRILEFKDRHKIFLFVYGLLKEYEEKNKDKDIYGKL